MSACAAAAGLTSPPEGYIGYVYQNTAIAFIVIETAFVALRFFARHVAGTRMGADDVLVPLALIINFALCGVCIAMVRYGGIGHHTLYLCMTNPSALITYAKLQIPFVITQAFAIALAKLAILSLFLRIFVQPVYRWTTYALMFIQVGSVLANTLVTGFQCTPISYLWEPQLHPDGHCIDFNAFWRWGNFPQIVTDIAILLLPLPCLWQLKLSKKDRLGVVVTFCTGSVGLFTSIIRFIFFVEIDGQSDGAWVAVKLGSISIAESGVYLIAACLPVYRSLFKTAASRMGSSYGSRNSKSPYASRSISKQWSGHDTELGSVSKGGRGFERLEGDERRLVVSNSPLNGSEYEDLDKAEKRGVQIQVERNFSVTSTHR